MNTHRKQKKQLTAAILAALLAMPAYGHALTRPPEYARNLKIWWTKPGIP